MGLVGAALACSSPKKSANRSGGFGGGSDQHVCAPGDTQACACPAGAQGAQACNTDGTAWEACLGCPDVGGTGGMAGAGTGGAGGSVTGGTGGADGSPATGGVAGMTGTGGLSAAGGLGGAAGMMTGTGGLAGIGGMTGSGAVAGTAGTSGTAGSAGVAGMAGSSGTGGGTGSPCGSVPIEGVCLSASIVRRCSVPTGGGVPQVVTNVCSLFEECTTIGGIAGCFLKPSSSCQPDDSECATSTTLRLCDSNAQWTSISCPGPCTETALGAFCSGGTPTSVFSGTLQYEFQGPNASFTNWGGTIGVAPAVDVLVISYRNQQFVDAVLTNDGGAFTIQVPMPAQPGDQVRFFLARPSATGTGIAVAVAEPDVPDGTQELFPIPSDTSFIWQWGIDLQLWPSGSTIQIDELQGSGAMRIYDYLRYSYAISLSYFTRTPTTVVAWIRNNTAWSCGACFTAVPAELNPYEFDSQIWFPAVAQDESYWSDPVTAHEIGHWTMASFGTSPREGGKHCLSIPTFPGQAWSEGWATGFSSLARSSSTYYDKQGGSFFWVDLAARQYGSGAGWTRPSPVLGLLQDMDENEVAAMIWELIQHPSVGDTLVMAALESPRMNTSPFGRGYTRHIWDIPSGCFPKTDIFDTQSSAPMFADFLDALRCDGVSALAIDSVTRPSLYYPYPSATPICP